MPVMALVSNAPVIAAMTVSMAAVVAASIFTDDPAAELAAVETAAMEGGVIADALTERNLEIIGTSHSVVVSDSCKRFID